MENISILNLALEVRDLACVRGQRALFAGVNFSLAAGRMLSVEGPNGAGKTSLLRMIAGFLRPAAGTILLRKNGKEVADDEERGKFVGWLGHHDAVKPQLSVREQLVFFARFYASGRNPDDAMRIFGLMPLAELPGQYLSAGQKRRLALARLQLSARPIWLLDEPLAALDAAGKKLVAETIAVHCTSGGMAIAATHDALGVECEKLSLGAKQ
jgi:heme exporter protein A